MARKRH
jgi:hypothetical protein